MGHDNKLSQVALGLLEIDDRTVKMLLELQSPLERLCEQISTQDPTLRSIDREWINNFPNIEELLAATYEGIGFLMGLYDLSGGWARRFLGGYRQLSASFRRDIQGIDWKQEGVESISKVKAIQSLPKLMKDSYDLYITTKTRFPELIGETHTGIAATNRYFQKRFIKQQERDPGLAQKIRFIDDQDDHEEVQYVK